MVQRGYLSFYAHKFPSVGVKGSDLDFFWLIRREKEDCEYDKNSVSFSTLPYKQPLDDNYLGCSFTVPL